MDTELKIKGRNIRRVRGGDKHFAFINVIIIFEKKIKIFLNYFLYNYQGKLILSANGKK
jgi:hypothetical protein